MSYSVPSVAGVPALLDGVTSAVSDIASLAYDFYDYSGLPLGQEWGVYQNGALAVTAETVVSFDYRKEYVVADYSIETGAFQSYDIVERPFDLRMRLATGGDESARASLISGVQSILGTTNLYEFLTPEAVYENVAIAHADYHRSADHGAGMIIIDVWGWQIIQGATSGVTDAASGNDAINTGSPQATDLTNSSFTSSSLAGVDTSATGYPNLTTWVGGGGGGVDTSIASQAFATSGVITPSNTAQP